jgi:hypothetical protein
MNNVEKRLYEMGKSYKEMNAPVVDYPEISPKRRHRGIQWAAVILLIFSIYHYDTFAYYAQKLIGYEEVASTSLQELFNEGYGQPIGKSVTFDTGETIWLDEVMTDDNNTILFARIINQNKLNMPSTNIKTNIPFFNPSGSSSGYMDEKTGTIYWVIYLESPRLFEKRYDIAFTLDSGETQHISYSLNRLSSTGKSRMIAVNQTIEGSGTLIKVTKLTLSPTSSRIHGVIESAFIDKLDMELLYDDKKADHLSKGIHGAGSGKATFEIDFEPLREGTESISILIENIWSLGDEEHTISLGIQDHDIENHQLTIIDSGVRNNQAYVRIKTLEGILLKDVSINGKHQLIKTIHKDYLKTEDGLYEERTLTFDTAELPESLTFAGMIYPHRVDQIILIE